jgi:hypothetical protein
MNQRAAIGEHHCTWPSTKSIYAFIFMHLIMRLLYRIGVIYFEIMFCIYKQVQNKLYVAGQIAMCPANLAIIEGGIVSQARLSLRHVQRILEAMHCGMDKLTMIVCYITNISYVQSAQKELQKSTAVNEVKLN